MLVYKFLKTIVCQLQARNEIRILKVIIEWLPNLEWLIDFNQLTPPIQNLSRISQKATGLLQTHYLTGVKGSDVDYLGRPYKAESSSG